MGDEFPGPFLNQENGQWLPTELPEGPDTVGAELPGLVSQAGWVPHPEARGVIEQPRVFAPIILPLPAFSLAKILQFLAFLNQICISFLAPSKKQGE